METNQPIKEGRTEKATRNLIFGIIQKIITLACPFVIRTIILYVLGAEYLGLNSLFTSILQMLSLAELGFGSAMVFALYKPLAQEDEKTICSILNYINKVYKTIGTAMLIAGIAVMPFLRIIIEGDVPADINLYLLYAVYLLNSTVSYFLYGYKQCVIIAAQRNDVISKNTSLVQIVTFILQVGILFLTKSYFAYIILLPISTAVTNIINAKNSDKLFPQYQCKGTIDVITKKEILKRTKALLGIKLNAVVLHASDSIVISCFLGLTAVAIYGNYHHIINAVGGFILILYTSLSAGIGDSIVNESISKNYNDMKNLFFMHAWLVGLCTICLLCLYEPFMLLWVKRTDYIYPFSMVILFSLYFYSYHIERVIMAYKDAAGLWWEEKSRPYFCMILNLILNVILIQQIGYYGVILSTIISLIISIPWETHTVFKYLFKMSSFEYYKKFVYYFVVTVISAAITYSICALIPLKGIALLAARLLVCAVIPNLIFLLVYRKMYEFKESIIKIKKILHIK